MRGKTIQSTVSFSVFLLSGAMIFSPLHKSDNLFISLVFAFLTGLICIFAALRICEKKDTDNPRFKKLSFIAAILLSVLSAATTLLILTETIKDVSYIANRGISFAYYCFIAFSILIVSYYLCCNSSKGIFRFCIPAVFPFLLLIAVIFSTFSTTGIYFDNLKFNNIEESILSSSIQGIISGLFFFADTIVFIYCFNDLMSDKSGKLMKHSILVGFIIAFSFIGIYNTVTFMIFGSSLTKQLSDPDYALIKLVPGIDMTELISALRIISFIIKSSVYIFSSSLALGKSISGEKKLHVIFIPTIYLTIVPVFVLFYTKGKTLGYGAFQSLVYPLTPIIGLLFMLIFLMSQKNIK